MKTKALLLALVLVLCLNFTGCSGLNNVEKVSLNGDAKEDGTILNVASVSDSLSAQANDVTVTIRDIEAFLKDKKAHYPLSDEFIERYQQAGGGYIDNAKKAGLTVDKQKHEPNQKWHFFESWLYPSIEDGSLTWDADAKRRVYTNLLCPELLLWIYEAAGVDPSKVRDAKEVAEQGRAAGTSVTTIAKNMRACVPWEDIANAVKGFKPMPSVTLIPSKTTLNVGEQAVITATLLNAGDVTATAAWSISEGSDYVSIVPNGNEATVSAIAKGTAKIKVSYGDNLGAECTVTVKEQSVVDPSIEGSVKYDIKYDLGARKTAKKIESVEELLGAFELVGEGNGIISSVSFMENVYGGGNGGRGETSWYAGDMLKFGTTNVCGSITFELNAEVSRIIITGYVSDNGCKIKVGSGSDDGNATTVICSEMSVAGKDVVEGKQTSTITIDFESANCITIETTNKKPLYITSIEFVVAANGNQQKTV